MTSSGSLDSKESFHRSSWLKGDLRFFHPMGKPGTDALSSNSPLRSYAKGKNSLWLLNSESYSSVTMRMLIEKQAAAADRLNSPSRLEEFAANSPPRRRKSRSAPPGTGHPARGGDLLAVSAEGHRARACERGEDACSHQTKPGGGVPLVDLISATTPQRERRLRSSQDGVAGLDARISGTRRNGTVPKQKGNNEARQALARETYTKTFSGMQAYGESGMTLLEELIDAAFRACDIGHAQGQQLVTGAALLTRSGKIYSGYNVESSSVDLNIGAERTAVLKAVSEGEIRFRSLAMASDTSQAFPSPDGPGRQFLVEFGDFPIYLVNRDLQVKIVSTGELYPMMPPGPPKAGLGTGGALNEAIVAANRERKTRNPRDWDVQEVLDWVEDELELGEYRREFARAKIDGALLLSLEDQDLQNVLGVKHPLHRRRVCLGIQKMKEAETQEIRKDHVEMETYVKSLDQDRIRLITKLKVIFDRFDDTNCGVLSVAGVRTALEYMGRDVNTEACAQWLSDKGNAGGGINFVDFTTAYSALFVDDDPDVHLEDVPTFNGSQSGVTMTGTGHVRLKGKASSCGRQARHTKRRHDHEERNLWAGTSSETEGEEHRKPRLRRASPRKDEICDDEDQDGQAFKALRSVRMLAEVKRVFDRFAVDGMLTANDTLQALTESGCTAPRTHAGRYLRSRRFFGLRREVTFFEFLRSLAALGVHDSGEHVAGFAPSTSECRTGRRAPTSSTNRRWRQGRERCQASIPDRRRRDARKRNGRLHDSSESLTSVAGSSEGSKGDYSYYDEAPGPSRSRRRPEISNRELDGRRGRPPSAESSASNARRRRRASSARRTGDGRKVRSRLAGEYGEGNEGKSRRSRSYESGDDLDDLGSRERRSVQRGARRSRSREASNTPPRRSQGHRYDRGSESVDHSVSDQSALGSSSRGGGGRGGGGGGRGGGGGLMENQRDRHRTRAEHSREPNHRCVVGREERKKGHERERDLEGGRDAGYGSPQGRASPRGNDKDTYSKSGSPRARYEQGSSTMHSRGGVRPGSGDERRGSIDDGPSSKLRRGDTVEVRYRGKGTKFYKGVVARANLDGTLDVDYDDGEKEIAIAREHVRSFEACGDPHARDAVVGRYSFTRGDPVEARYRGKGNIFYKGRVSRVNSDGTLDVDYDDGGKDQGIAEDHVRLLRSLDGRPDGRDEDQVRDEDRDRDRDRDRNRERDGDDATDESTLREGDEVEVNYQGRGRHYKGRISRVNLDKTVNVDYDDGEKERGVTRDMIRPVEGSRGQTAGCKAVEGRRSDTPGRGDKVEVRYRGKGTKFYKGTVSRANSDGTFDIDYDDGEKEVGIAEEHVRLLKAARSGRVEPEPRQFQKGDTVEARYQGRGTKFLKGKIFRVNPDGTFDINYDRGEKELGIAEEHIRALGVEGKEAGCRSRDAGGHGGPFQQGDEVEVNVGGRGRYHKGRVHRENSDGTLDIDYVDGERQREVPSHWLRKIESDERSVKSPVKPQRGDKVGARYRGRGNKFYRGKVARINSDGTFDIDYDDGDRDTGLAKEHVILLPSGESQGSVGRADAGKFKKGDLVEARYRGKGVKFYKGEVARVNSDGTLDIRYNDGDKELGIDEEHVRLLGASAAQEDRQQSGSFKKGDRVEARYRGRVTKFYEGKIAHANLDGTFDIDYDDGERELGIAEEHIRSLGKKTSAQEKSQRRKLEKGDRVEVRYRGQGTKFYKGRISRVNSDGTLDVRYDDGERELGITEERVRLLEASSPAQRRSGRDGLEKGDAVEARYRGRGAKFYKGKIARVHPDGTFDINYDDGEKELGLAEEHIRVLESQGVVRRDEESRAFLSEGDAVEARLGGRGSYRKGRISRVNLDGTFNIDYDSGEKERGVASDMIQSCLKGSVVSGESSMFQRGDRVEARYRARGTKFYMGTVVRVNSDATLDIDYDDGEKEYSLAAEHVKSLHPKLAERRGNMGCHSHQRGERIEANYLGRGRYFQGRISRVNLDGTFDVDYDDGEKENGVRSDMIRSLPESYAGGNQTNQYHRLRFAQGDTVEVRYRGRGVKFYKGRVARVNSDGTFDIDYDDGETEKGIAEEHVRPLGSDKNDGRRSLEQSNRISEGDRVEANYGGRGRFFKGRVIRVHGDGTFDVQYDDGESEHGVERHMIRVLDSAPSPGRKSTPDRRDDDDDPRTLRRGDRVEARYRGRGTKFYKGTIVRVNSDATFDVDYDDGERESGLAAKHVRSLESRSEPERRGDQAQSGELREGDEVECDYRRRGRDHKGRIAQVNIDGTFNIEYDDGEKERGVVRDLICLAGGRKSPSARSRAAATEVTLNDADDHRVLGKGDVVEARYRGKGSKFYRGKIVRVNPDGTFDIDYDDGDKERGIARENVRPVPRSGSRPGMGEDGAARSTSIMGAGDRVEARYRGKGNKFYAGTVARVNPDGSFDIVYDDGDAEAGVSRDYVRPLGHVSTGSREPAGPLDGNSEFKEGSEVEVNYRGTGRFYKGRITRVNFDGTFEVWSQDGERESEVHRSMIRRAAKQSDDAAHHCHRDRDPTGRNSNRSASTALEQGDEVEARYRGRGTTYYKGRIARVNPDETFDINYDDGEKEVGLAAEHVRRVGNNNDPSTISPRRQEGFREANSAGAFVEGDQVECNYRDKGRYRKARVARCNLDGTFNVEYDDGEKDRGVPDHMIRHLDGGKASAAGGYRGAVDSERNDNARGALRRGDRVEARYKGKGTKFYRGYVSRVHSDGTLDIDYDDGEEEVGIAEEHVRLI